MMVVSAAAYWPLRLDPGAEPKSAIRGINDLRLAFSSPHFEANQAVAAIELPTAPC
jgi:hypothetical protein